MLMPKHAALLNLTRKLWRMTAEIEADTRRIKTGYDPNEPRVPAGQTGGGQWTSIGGGRGRRPPIPLPGRRPPPAPLKKPRGLLHALTPEELARFNLSAPSGTPRGDLEPDPSTGLPRWYVGGAVDRDVVSPLDFIGGGSAGKLAKPLGEMTVAESGALVTRLRARFLGRKVIAAENPKIVQAEKTILEHLGGEPDFWAFKNNGDMTLIKDDLMVRFDIVKVGSSKNARPHFQLQRRISPEGSLKEDWEDIGEHWYEFLDSKDFIGGKK